MRTRPPEIKLLNVKAGGLRWTVRSGAEGAVSKVCSAVEQFLSDASQHIKNSRNVTVARVALGGASCGRGLGENNSLSLERLTSKPDGKEWGSTDLPPPEVHRGLIIRRMNYGRLRHRLRDFFRWSRARRAFFLGLRLERAGVSTPRMLAVAEVRKFRWPVAAYLICDEVPNAQTLAAFVQNFGRAGSVESRTQVCDDVTNRLADVIAQLHEAGFVHRDLKASNVLLDRELNPWLIDMDGVRYVGNVTSKQVMANLMVLANGLPVEVKRKSAKQFVQRYWQRRSLDGSFLKHAQKFVARIEK